MTDLAAMTWDAWVMLLLAWFLAGLTGSHIIQSCAFREPWFDPAKKPPLLSPMPLFSAAVFGPMNLFVSLFFAIVFRRKAKEGQDD